MADGDDPSQEGPGCSEPAPAGQSGLSGLAETLREEIMVDVEARLSQKADSLWKRGQAELGKMQQDRKEVATSITELQKRQESLMTEQTVMHRALLDIATKMEVVAVEMKEALRAVGKLDGAAANGGFLPEATSPWLGVTSPSELLGDLSALGFPPHGLEVDGAPPGLVLQGLCTPPRITPHSAASPTGPSIAPPLPGSPAVLLSLASALPSNTAPPAGTTRLHIADCLEMDVSSLVDSKARTGGISPVSTSSSLRAGVNGSSSSVGSPSRVDVASPTSMDAGGASFACLEGVAKDPSPFPGSSAFSKASGGTLRADAPAFVPGGSFAA